MKRTQSYREINPTGRTHKSERTSTVFYLEDSKQTAFRSENLISFQYTDDRSNYVRSIIKTGLNKFGVILIKI